LEQGPSWPLPLLPLPLAPPLLEYLRLTKHVQGHLGGARMDRVPHGNLQQGFDAMRLLNGTGKMNDSISRSP
jgi:hypothetical protein